MHTTLNADDEIIDIDTGSDTSTTNEPAVNTRPPPGHKLVNPFVWFRQQNSSGGFFKAGDVIKMDHNTGAVLRKRGNDVTVVEPEQCRFVVNPNEMIERWVKYISGELAQQMVYRTVGGEAAPKRCELDDVDWKASGHKRDPWGREVWLPMKDTDGEPCAFKATGNGAIAEIGELVGMYGSADRNGLVPVVEIESRSFDSQHGNTVHVPVFRLVSWELWNDQPLPPAQPVPVPIAPPPKPAPLAASPKPTAAVPDKARRQGGDMNDEIPF
jgi:hypothetical protein